MSRRIDAQHTIEALESAHLRALKGDADGVHELRVAARRLRVWVEFEGHDALAEELRWISRELGPLRDLEVVGEALTAEGLRSLQPAARTRARSALESPRWAAAKAGLRGVQPPRRKSAKRALKKLERKLAKRTLELDDAAIHSLRRLVRSVRYAREWLGRDARELEAAQRWLGALNDLHTLISLIN
jgi:CHAD domain-containing protein